MRIDSQTPPVPWSESGVSSRAGDLPGTTLSEIEDFTTLPSLAGSTPYPHSIRNDRSITSLIYSTLLLLHLHRSIIG
jgi:hypothetical protein